MLSPQEGETSTPIRQRELGWEGTRRTWAALTNNDCRYSEQFGRVCKRPRQAKREEVRAVISPGPWGRGVRGGGAGQVRGLCRQKAGAAVERV